MDISHTFLDTLCDLVSSERTVDYNLSKVDISTALAFYCPALCLPQNSLLWYSCSGTASGFTLCCWRCV